MTSEKPQSTPRAQRYVKLADAAAAYGYNLNAFRTIVRQNPKTTVNALRLNGKLLKNKPCLYVQDLINVFGGYPGF